MKLTEEQCQFVRPLLPKPKVRKDRRGRPWKDPRGVLEGILWILKTGARWQDLPDPTHLIKQSIEDFSHG